MGCEPLRPRSRVAGHQLRMDGAGRHPLPALAKPLREPLAETVLPGDDAGRRADDSKRHELRGSPEPRPKAGAQKARLAGARGGLDCEETWAAAMPDLAQ